MLVCWVVGDPVATYVLVLMVPKVLIVGELGKAWLAVGDIVVFVVVALGTALVMGVVGEVVVSLLVVGELVCVSASRVNETVPFLFRSISTACRNCPSSKSASTTPFSLCIVRLILPGGLVATEPVALAVYGVLLAAI